MPQHRIFLVASRKHLNPILDNRVKEMVLNRHFFKEVMQFAELVASAHEKGETNDTMLKNSALFNCIGFKETITFLKACNQDSSLLDLNPSPTIKNRLKTLTNQYVQDF